MVTFKPQHSALRLCCLADSWPCKNWDVAAPTAIPSAPPRASRARVLGGRCHVCTAMSLRRGVCRFAAFACLGLVVLTAYTFQHRPNSAPPRLTCGKTPLSSLQNRLKYAEGGYADVSGWMAPANAFIAAYLSSVQHGNSVCGNVGEIGVHHGLFSIALAHTAMDGETLTFVDLFSDQKKNKDASGRGDLEKLYVG